MCRSCGAVGAPHACVREVRRAAESAPGGVAEATVSEEPVEGRAAEGEGTERLAGLGAAPAGGSTSMSVTALV